MELTKTKRSIRSIALVAMLLAILVIQEEILFFIPNVQFTVIFIIVYAQFLSKKELYPLVIAYVILDNLIMGSFNFLYTPAMFFSWLLLAFVSRTLRFKPDYVQLIIAILFAFIYGWSFIPATAIIQHFTRWNQVFTYLKYDIIFEFIMAISGLVTYLTLYVPLTKLFKKFYQKDNELL